MRTVLILASAACAMLSACANLDPLDGQDLTDGFSERVIEVNNAYRSERNAQILINILRARDRQDRKYTGLSELKIAPTAKSTTELSAGDIKLGNNDRDPWVTLGATSTFDNSSSLELTISPNAKDPDENSVYRSPVSAEQFQALWASDWPKDIIRELLVDQLTPLFLSDGANAAVVQSLLDERRPYTVLSNPRTGELMHCIEGPVAKEGCKLNVVQVTVKVKEDKKKLKTKNEEDKFEKVNTRFEYDSKQKPPVATSLLPRLREALKKPAGRAALAKSGRFLFCRQEVSGADVRPKNAPSTETPPPQDIYNCSGAPIGSVVCAKFDDDGKCVASKSLSTVMFWVNADGVYTVSLNSIDDAIYALGDQLRREKGGLTCSPEMAHMVCGDRTVSISSSDDTKAPIIAVGAIKDGEKSAAKACIDQYSAVVRYADNKVYFAGAPQAFDAGNSGADYPCHLHDRTGTVLTFIAELIELRQVPITLTPTTLLFRD